MRPHHLVGKLTKKASPPPPLATQHIGCWMFDVGCSTFGAKPRCGLASPSPTPHKIAPYAKAGPPFGE
ncbi:hypothetical protein Ga0100230_022810 [Opitutaceae bacterium TAV3]|nr:hypothetical protein Ga0100230_022810 [Opitutaceae bacterium TAV3]